MSLGHRAPGTIQPTNKVEWLEMEGDEAAEALTAECQRLDSGSERIEQQGRWKQFARAIANQEIEFDDLTQGQVTSVSLNPLQVAWNAMYAADRALRAKIQKAKPRIQILTSDGSRKQRKKAKSLNQWLDGWFYSQAVGETIKRAHTDGLRFDCGFVLLEGNEQTAQIDARWVRPWDAFIDSVDALDCNPKVIRIRRWMSGQEVLDKWGEGHATEPGQDETPDDEVRVDKTSLRAIKIVRDAARNNLDWSGEKQGSDALENKGRVCVWEAWARGTKDRPGRHLVACEGRLMHDEDWEHDWTPVVPMRYEQRPQGYWGLPPTEIVAPIQAEISRQLATIQSVQKKTVKPRTYVRNGTTLIQPLTSEDGETYQVVGEAPVHVTPQGLPKESYEWLAENWRKVFEILGLSDMSVTGRAPRGIESGVGLREYQDMESGLFALPSQEFEEGFVACARVAIALARKLYEKGIDICIKAPGTETLKKISWSEVDLEEDFEMRPWPVSSLPQTPAALKEYVTELFEQGFISKTTALSLIQFPDVEAQVNLELAGIEEVQDMIADILDKGILTLPDEFCDASSGVVIGRAELRKARADKDIPPKNIEKLKRWIRECQALLKLADAKEAPAAPPGPATIPGQGGPMALGAPGVASPDVAQLQAPAPVMPGL